MNKWIGVGRLTADPKSRVAGEKNTTFTDFTIACDRAFKTKDVSADFINCQAFGKTAETIEKFFKKGSKILVEGELQNNNYKDKDGKMVYQMKVSVSRFEFVESKTSNSDDEFVNVINDANEELPFN